MEYTYQIRPINLTSHMELLIEAGARLRGIANASVWPVIPALPSYGQGRDHIGPRYTSLIHGEHLVNVTIRGQDPESSLIDGTGNYWWNRHESGEENKHKITRGSLVEFLHTTNLVIESIGLRNSPFWTVHPYDCDHVHIRNVHIRNPHHSPNTDGFDPDSSRHVTIEDSSYDGGDDCVAIKSGWDCFGIDYGTPCSHITIRNLTCWTNSISLGSEISGGLEHIHASNLYFPNGTFHPIRLKTGQSRGGYIRNVTIRDVVVLAGELKGSALDVNMNLYTGRNDGRNPSCPADWTPPHASIVEDLVFSDWNGRAAHWWTDNHESSFDFWGISAESPVRNVWLQDIYFPERKTRNGSTSSGASSWSCRHIENITAVNGTITPWPPCEGVQVVNPPPENGSSRKSATTTPSKERQRLNYSAEASSFPSRIFFPVVAFLDKDIREYTLPVLLWVIAILLVLLVLAVSSFFFFPKKKVVSFFDHALPMNLK
jgi:hypothetical protein